jgi:hypothetical protein
MSPRVIKMVDALNSGMENCKRKSPVSFPQGNFLSQDHCDQRQFIEDIK